MKVQSFLVAAALVLGASVAQVAEAGRTEVVLRESDVISSGSEPLEVVLRVAEAPTGGTRIDVAWIELTLNVEGESEGFVPFLVVAEAVLPSGPGGAYEPAWRGTAREILVGPGSGQVIRLDATRLVRQWRGAGGELLLRIRVVEPAEAVRPAESVQFAGAGGILGKAVLVAR